MYKKIYKNMSFLSMLTLVLTALIMISASHSIFINQLKNELKNEAVMIADFLNTVPSPADSLSELSLRSDNKKINLINKSGQVLFSSYNNGNYNTNFLENPEILDATKNGYGYFEKTSYFTSKSYYFTAVRLNNNDILRIETSSESVISSMLSIIVVMLFLASLIYILSIIIAIRLTENIIKPIEKFYSLEDDSSADIYDEIKPFLHKIEQQNKEINRQMKKINSQKFRLRAITNNMNEGLIIINKQRFIVSLNYCTIDLFNVNEYNYRQKKIDEITSDEKLIDAVNSALEGNRIDIIIPIRSKTYQVFCSPVLENTQVSGVIILLFDITSKAETEQIRKEFTANVSHELKTPLTSIHGFAQIITSGIAKAEDINGFARKIEKESSRLIVLIDDIIKLSKLDENISSMDKESFYIRPVINEIVEMLGVKIQEKNISLTILGDDTCIFANPSQITEMLYNLCDNAIKYNKQNGSIVINISEKQVSVSDSGIGIPVEDIDRIFERFFRVDKSHSKKVNGTGLGLSIVKHIAQINNALIDVKSTLNEGSTFTVTFRE